MCFVDKASGGDGPWISTESKTTQWSPRGGIPAYLVEDEDLQRFVDQTTEMSPEHCMVRRRMTIASFAWKDLYSQGIAFEGF